MLLRGIKHIIDRVFSQSVNEVIHIFFYLDFLSRTFANHRTAGERGGYFFNSSLPLLPLYRHLDISRVITTESSPLHITSSRSQTEELLVSECKSLTIYYIPYIMSSIFLCQRWDNWSRELTVMNQQRNIQNPVKHGKWCYLLK